jgi:hypothetical protein
LEKNVRGALAKVREAVSSVKLRRGFASEKKRLKVNKMKLNE